jgi:protein SCO1/2
MTSKLRRLTAAALVLLLAGCSDRTSPAAAPSSPFAAVDVTGVPWGHDFHLQDPQGRERSLADFKGRVVMLYFGYTNCPDMCPATLAKMAQARKALGPDAARVQGLFVSVDPHRDTAELLARYVPGFDNSFIGLRGDDSATAAAARDFKIFFAAQTPGPGGGYTVDHSGGIYVFDTGGRLRLMMRPDAQVDAMVADLRQLLLMVQP